MAQINTFNHPFEHPYQVQLDLMQEIYDTLKNGYKVGIFESPTGTGKTLSLICSTMTWLREYKKMHNEGLIKDKLKSAEEDDDEEDEPEWVRQSFIDKIMSEYVGEAKKYEEHLARVHDQGTSVIIDGNIGKKGNVKIYKKRKTEKLQNDETIDDLAPDDFDILDDTTSKSGISRDVEFLLERFENKSKKYENKIHSTQINESKVKIFFVSRTHSQLSQFSSQLKLTTFPSSIDQLSGERIKYLPLGSRKQLCINESVSKLVDSQAINKACQNLQQSTDENKKCQYMPNPFNEEHLHLKDKMNDLVMSDIRDIEDIHELGEQLRICPYYSTRADIPIAEIISMPYQLLLHKDTRHILGLDLQNSVVVIDEAHNLLDTISRIYSTSVSLNDLKMVRKALKLYTRKFMLKMSAGNRINIAKLNKIISKLYKFIEASNEKGIVTSGKTVDRDDIFGDDVSELLNIYELETYLIKSKLAFKLESYMEKVVKVDGDELYKSSGQPILFGIKSFLYSLSNPLKSGKFFWDKSENDLSLKYLLLDPSEDFKEIVEEAKCVILAGGTMEPVSEFTDFLVPYLEKDKIHQFSCDHVIPDENLIVFPIGRYRNTEFEFSFQRRNNDFMITKLGESFCELLREIPAGCVAFFPSYSYLSQVLESWRKSGVYETLDTVKKIFTESKDKSVDETLSEFKQTIELDDNRKGAFLLSVVGGKLSEGINFSDDLARAVFMIGLPYPNAFSSDLIAKREYIEQKYLTNGKTESYAKRKSQEFYENLCMKAVNQSVGRAIRNINDYATIYLFDSRYGNPRIVNKLSQWVKKRVLPMNTTNPVLETRAFFEKHAQR